MSDTPATWGKPYGCVPDPSYIDGQTGAAYFMYRRGQRVRFYDRAGQQVGPEQANVAPAIAYAHSQRWFSPELARAGIFTPYDNYGG
jgi:hypothetical protein